jgi:serine O-acetyltransferase
MREDVTAVLERDPAARTPIEVVLLYPGLHAVWAHRVSHTLWTHGAKFGARAMSQAARFATGVEIHPGAQIGPRLFIDHAAGVVIGETAEVGADVTVYHGVTLGGLSLDRVKRHPTVGDRVIIGAGAKVLGPIDIGADSRIGANAVLVKSVAPNSTVVGVPGQVLAPHAEADPGNEHDPVAAGSDPDPVAFAVRSLLRRVATLEEASGNDPGAQIYRPDGVWDFDDYAI